MEAFFGTLREVWLVAVGVLAVAIPVLASLHILLTKRDVRAAIGWVGFVWFVPLIGAAIYWILGINRIQRRALRERLNRNALPGGVGANPDHSALPADTRAGLAAHAVLGNEVGLFPLTKGNSVVALENGDDAFPAMVSAIQGAKRAVALSTYIFENDSAGREFVEALTGAVRRGVEVRVLIDGIGNLYGRPLITGVLAQLGVPVGKFNADALPWRMSYLNLRNHRKLLVVDGEVGFTGGMNIRQGNCRVGSRERRITDTHFRLKGPVVRQLLEVFADDWTFTTGEELDPARWFERPIEAGDTPIGSTIARGLAGGPDERAGKLAWILASALAMARKRVRLVTPYFLPEQVLITALNQAALRGVEVDIILPGESNLPVVHWASRVHYRYVLEKGCRIFLTPPPFDHTKLLVVDGEWTLFGSTNWDPRSLRLNFEFDVECFDASLASDLDRLAASRIERAREVTLEDIKKKSILTRVRDGFAWLLSPYL